MLPVVAETERETESDWGSHDDVTMPSSKHETSSTRLPYTRWEAIAEDDEDTASPSPVEFHRFEEDRRSDGSDSRSKPSLSAIFSPRGRKHSPTNNNNNGIAIVSSPVIARSRQQHQDSWCWRNATKILGIKQYQVHWTLGIWFFFLERRLFSLSPVGAFFTFSTVFTDWPSGELNLSHRLILTLLIQWFRFLL